MFLVGDDLVRCNLIAKDNFITLALFPGELSRHVSYIPVRLSVQGTNDLGGLRNIFSRIVNKSINAIVLTHILEKVLLPLRKVPRSASNMVTS